MTGFDSQRIMYAPSALESFKYNKSINAAFFSPLTKIQGFPVVGYLPIISLVVALLFASGPLAVIFEVSFIVVDSFYCVLLCWLFSHVRIKRPEIIPAVTNRYSSPSIMSVASIVFIVASLAHSYPSFILRKLLHAVIGKTTAGFSMATFKAIASGNKLGAAKTNAIPRRMMPNVFSAGNNGNLIEFLTGKVFEYCHNILHKILFHLKCVCRPAWKPAFGATLDTGVIIHELR